MSWITSFSKKMALTIIHLKLKTLLLLALIFTSAFRIISSEAEEEQEPGINIPVHDPAQIVAKALLCFNDKYIYSSCEESYRLSASGNLDVPSGQTEAYCGGPCLSETELVLSCIHNIFTDFLFYNKATIQDVQDTIQSGCGYGPHRGDFNVASHLEAKETAVAPRALVSSIDLVVSLVLGVMVIGHGLVLMM